ncbi:MAG TPA: carbonic anhydrase [Gemmatimonadales bacterium]|nr:carbonic anhydrase [Gemmatimonadales bacterium]
MRSLPQLFEKNRKWAAHQVAHDPRYFERLLEIQRPPYLWIGCADSRVPANEIVGLAPGEIFVHRNVANVVRHDDPNALSVIQYAVDVLAVRHIIVTGHHGCGGIIAALGPPAPEPLETWLTPIRALRDRHAEELARLDPTARPDRLCELNVAAQVSAVAGTATVRQAWAAGKPLAIHGWFYDLKDGLLHDLDVTVDLPEAR